MIHHVRARENAKEFVQSMQEPLDTAEDAKAPLAATTACLPRHDYQHGLTRALIRASSLGEIKPMHTSFLTGADALTPWHPLNHRAPVEWRSYDKVQASEEMKRKQAFDEMRRKHEEAALIRAKHEEAARLRAKQEECSCWNFLTCWRCAGGVQRRPWKRVVVNSAHEKEAASVPASASRQSAVATETSAAPRSGVDESEVLSALARDALYVAGVFTGWSVEEEYARLQPALIKEPGADVARLRLCVQLSSQSFTFCIVCARRGWNWRLYARDARNVFGTHASKEGRLWSDQPDAVAIAVGDKWKGHALNFHVVEDAGTIVTIWVEVPLKRADNGQVFVNFYTARGARVWYTKEDTGVQCRGGDGIDLSFYSYLRSFFED
mmetsp:Transcript_69637/g.121125  ORF Transcript_69637/g.121125 Transcript_69637/m.121125 type:complete len:380 (+) Transcript_69637:102-1241(+)